MEKLNTGMRKALSLLLAIVMVMSFGITALAANKAAVTVETAAKEAEPGEEVTLDVSIADNPGFSVMETFIDYDRERLELKSINTRYTATIDGEEKQVSYIPGATDTTMAKVPSREQAEKCGLYTSRKYGYTITQNYSGAARNGTIFTLTFKVRNSAKVGFADVKVVFYNICNDSGEIPSEAISGGINVKAASISCRHLNMKENTATDADCITRGYEAYWICPDCSKMFSDAEGKNEISKMPIVPKLGHKYENGVCTRCGRNEPAYEMYVEIGPNTDADGDEFVEIAVGDKLTAKVMLRSLEDTTLQYVDAFVGIDSIMDAVTPTGGAYNLTVTEDESRGGYTLYSDKLSVDMKAGEAIELARVQMTVTDRDTHGLFTIVVPRPSIKVAGNDEEIMPSYQGIIMIMSTQTVTFVTASGRYEVEYPLHVLPNFADVKDEGATTDKPGYTFAGWSPVFSPVIGEANSYTAQYTANEYKIKFVDENGVTIDEVPFTYEETAEIDEPEVPAKDGYEGAWGSYDLTKPENQTVAPVYTGLGKEPVISFEDYAYAAGDQVLLVVQTDELESGSYMFDGQPLYWTDSKDYGVNGAYITLADKAWAEKQSEAAKALTVDTKAETVKVDRDGDVNGDGKTDVHDAGVVYKLLNANGDAFKDLTILDRLECDVVTSQVNVSCRGNLEDVNAIMSIYLAD